MNYFSSLSHSSVLVLNTINCSTMLSTHMKRVPVLYRGIGHKVDTENVLAMKVPYILSCIMQFVVVYTIYLYLGA